jgi:DNA-binding NtrC family response regulator
MTNDVKVLVADDEEVVRASYMRTLAQKNWKVEAVLNGTEALKQMECGRFDVVLLDLRMPGPDGLSVLKTIKDRWPETEVVIITGYPSVETAKEAVSLGAHDYLAKPVGPDEIVGAAARAFARKQWALRRVERPTVS